MRDWGSVIRSSGMMICAGLIATVISSPSANASEYPNKVIKMIVAVAAGGPTDVLARTLAEAMSAGLGQPVIVENRTGAGGVTGYGAVASAPPDGYTISFVDSGITVHPSLYDTLPYAVGKDLIPISSVARGPTVLVTRKSLDVKNPPELVALAKRNPGKLTYGSAGTGTPPHLYAELFKVAQDIDITHIPYRGASPVIADLLAERIDIAFLAAGPVRVQVETGGLKALAVSGKERLATLAGVPTFYEAQLPMPQFDAGTWWGVMAPAKLPADIRQTLTEAIGKALKSKNVVKQLEEMGVEPQPSTAQEFDEFIGSELKKWADVVKRAKIKPE